MIRRDRVLRALNFQPVDQLPKDLGGMPSTCISCFAYPLLVAALGLPPRPTRVYDTSQMLALPDVDVLDALDCDVVTLTLQITNAYHQPEVWKPYTFNGRLDATVQDPSVFETRPDGTIFQRTNQSTMPPSSHVFETEHAGQPLLLTGDIPKPDLDAIRARQIEARLTDAQLEEAAAMFRRTREVSDRATFFFGLSSGIGIGNFTGLAMFPMLCLMEPEFVEELHELVVGEVLLQMERFLPLVEDCIDVYMISADDWGTQNAPIAAPQVYRDLFQPYYRRMNDCIHQMSPKTKTFLHSCGAIYDLLDDIVDTGFDVLNPVQWTAGEHSYKEWKDKVRGRLALWGGGVNSQVTLPLGSVDDITREVREVASYLAQDSGYVFNGIHNILAEIAPEKVIAMYRAAATIRQ